MKKHGLTQTELQSLKRSDALCKTVEEIAVIAMKNMMNVSGENARAAPALLTSVLARAYLKRLAGTGYDPFDERNMRPLPYRSWRLMIPALTGRI